MMCSTEIEELREDTEYQETHGMECPNCEWFMDKTGQDENLHQDQLPDDWELIQQVYEEELFNDYPEDLWVDPMEEEIIYE
jgi:hypothetical protein